MDAARRFDTFVGVMDSALAQSDYLVGSSFTLADAAAIPYVNRADMLGLAGLWENRRPRVAAGMHAAAAAIFNPPLPPIGTNDAQQHFDVQREEVWAECKDILSFK